MKIINTYYHKHFFRSRLEARWAVFYDTLHIKWIYEPEGYNLGNGLFYLPDFFMPEQNCFIEIKANVPEPLEIKKAERLCEFTKKDVLIFSGTIIEHEAHIWSYNQHIGPIWDNNYDWHKPTSKRAYARISRSNVIPKWDIVYNCGQYIDYSGEKEIEQALIKANCARFEFSDRIK